jgi:hypothetical protein
MDSPQDHLQPAETAQPPARPKRPLPLPLVGLIWFVVCTGVLTPIVRFVRVRIEDDRCQSCEYHLREIGIALQNFMAANGSLPPAYLCDKRGTPIHSWETLVMEYLGCYCWPYYYSLTEPWDGPNNRGFMGDRFYRFQCPTADATAGDPYRSTRDYVVVVGPETMWPGRDRVVLPAKPGPAKDKILLIELPDSDYRRLEPRFPTIEEFLDRIKSPTGNGIRTIHPKGLAYLTVSGAVRWFPPDTDPETIRQLLKRDPGCKVIPPEVKLKTVETWGQHREER